MDLFGRVFRFRVNRPLKDKEEDNRFSILIKNTLRRVSLPHHDYLSTIKMNSTYLELVDRCYPLRGLAGFSLGSGAIIMTVFFIATIPHIIRTWDESVAKDGLGIMIAVAIAFIVVGCMVVFFCILLYRDFFGLTHNPIRINRKNRMLYAFTYNDEVVSVPWDELIIYSGKVGSLLDLRAHIMDKDGVTIKHTIGFAIDGVNRRELQDYMDYLNFYMAKGPEKLLPIVERCLPIDGRKEGSVFGLSMFMAQFGCLSYVLLPLIIYTWFWRLATMATCKVPVWPDWVEAECQVEPDDPFIRTAEQDKPVRFLALLDSSGPGID